MGRRRELKGVDVLPSGATRIRLSAGVDPITGRRRFITETMPAGTAWSTIEARHAELVTKATRSGNHLTGRPPTLLEVTTAYQDRQKVRSTKAKNAGALKHVPAELARTRVDRLNGWDFDRLYDELLARGQGVESVRTLHGVLGAACTVAMRQGRIERNPVALATAPRAPDSQVIIPAPADVDRLVAAAAVEHPRRGQNVMHIAMLRFFLATGCRAGEVLAVRWSHVDLEHATVTIAGSIERGADRSTKETKGRRARTISIDPATVRLVKAWQSAQRLRGMELGAGLDRDPFLFSATPDSSRPLNGHMPSRWFDRLRTRAGVEGFSVHDLRHYHASQLLAQGIDVVAVSYRLGHASVATTLRVYAHVIQGRDRKASDTIAAVLDGV